MIKKQCFLCGKTQTLIKIPYSSLFACAECVSSYQNDNSETCEEEYIICPHCGQSQDSHDDVYKIKKTFASEIKCSKCGKRFDLKVKKVYGTYKSLCEMPKDKQK